EDGIRDFHVTGVQTCALPIFRLHNPARNAPRFHRLALCLSDSRSLAEIALAPRDKTGGRIPAQIHAGKLPAAFVDLAVVGEVSEIGRASCRERVWVPGGAGAA